MGWQIALGSAVVGGFMQASALRQQGAAEAAAHNYNSLLRERNADALEIEADTIKFANEWAIADFFDDFEELNKATSQAFRGNGWIAEGGTPLKVAMANAAEADEERVKMDFETASKISATRERAVNERMKAQLDNMYGRLAIRRRRTQAGQALFASAGKAYNIYRTA